MSKKQHEVIPLSVEFHLYCPESLNFDAKGSKKFKNNPHRSLVYIVNFIKAKSVKNNIGGAP